MARGDLVQTERHLPLIAVGTGGDGSALLHVDKALGVTNSRLYRQARSYRVRFVANNHNATGETLYEFYTLPSNYDTIGAVRLAYTNWLSSIQTELDGGANLAKWYDFRISPETITNGNSELKPSFFTGNAWAVLVADEYGFSTAQGSDGNAKGFHIGASSISNSFNIYQEWTDHLSNKQPTSTITAVQDVYTDLTIGDEHETREHLGETGDLAPYDLDRQTVRDGAYHLVLKDVISFDADGAVGVPRTSTFDAPLGVVVVRKQTDQTETDFSTSISELICVASPGSYKGVHAPAIVDFNPRALEQG